MSWFLSAKEKAAGGIGPRPGESDGCYYARVAAEGEARRKGRPLPSPPAAPQSPPKAQASQVGDHKAFAQAVREHRPGPLLPCGKLPTPRWRQPGEDD